MVPPPLSTGVADRLVDPPHAARLELLDKRRVGRQRACDHEQSARVLVQPVHEPGARHGRERRIQVQQGILKCPGRVARARMHDEAGRLVDDDELVVLPDNAERNGLGAHFGERLEFRLEHQPLASGKTRFRLRTRTVNRQSAVVYPRLEPAAREFRHEHRGRLIEPLAREIRRHHNLSRDPFHI